MKDEKKYRSFVIGVSRDRNTDKITTVVVGNKCQGKPADIISAYAGEEAQALYNILVGRQVPAIVMRSSAYATAKMTRDQIADNPDDIPDLI